MAHAGGGAASLTLVVDGHDVDGGHPTSVTNGLAAVTLPWQATAGLHVVAVRAPDGSTSKPVRIVVGWTAPSPSIVSTPPTVTPPTTKPTPSVKTTTKPGRTPTPTTTVVRPTFRPTLRPPVVSPPTVVTARWAANPIVDNVGYCSGMAPAQATVTTTGATSVDLILTVPGAAKKTFPMTAAGNGTWTASVPGIALVPLNPSAAVSVKASVLAKGVLSSTSGALDDLVVQPCQTIR